MFNSENFNDMPPGYYWFFNSFIDADGSEKIINRIIQIVEFKVSGPYKYDRWITAGKYVLMFGDESLNKIDYLISFGNKKHIKFIPINEPE